MKKREKQNIPPVLVPSQHPITQAYNLRAPLSDKEEPINISWRGIITTAKRAKEQEWYFVVFKSHSSPDTICERVGNLFWPDVGCEIGYIHLVFIICVGFGNAILNMSYFLIEMIDTLVSREPT